MNGLKFQENIYNALFLTLAFDHDQILTDASNRLRRNLEFSGLATRFLPDYFTLGQIQDVYETIWEVELDPANFRDKLTNVDGWIREVKNPPEDLEARRGKASNMV